MTEIHHEKKNTKKKWFFVVTFFCLIGCAAIVIASFIFFSPHSLKEEKIITIPNGFSVIQTGNLLQQEGIIKSGLVFRILVQLDNISIKSGTYQFTSGRYSLNEVIYRFDRADYGDVYISVTIPEGATNQQIGNIFSAVIPSFDDDVFTNLTKEKEGYLFPSTYQFLPEDTTEVMVKKLLDTFTEKTKTLKEETLAANKNWDDIIIMASLIEKEAGNSAQEQKTVSGILWKRLDKGMLLQVDAPFVYILGKGSSELSLSDLRKDSPYNTYTRKGLTPTPINNPGLSAIEAALYPITSSYYYYLHSPDGRIHYGVTHSDHINNKNRYLR
jgi:UPF0755 protein